MSDHVLLGRLPQVHGAWALQHAFAAAKLTSCVLFSSAAALLGGAGQANYSAANTCLDALALARHACGLVCISAQWGAWGEVGMASNSVVTSRVKASGVGLILSVMGLVAMQRMLQSRGAVVVAMVPARWGRVLGSTAVPSFLSNFAPAPKRAAAPPKRSAVAGAAVAAKSAAVGIETVLDLVRRTVGGSVDADAPLMDAGLDSLGAVELRNQLQEAVGDAEELPSSLVFEAPTVRQLAEYTKNLTPPEAMECVAAAPSIDFDTIFDLVRRTMGGSVDTDAPLMEAGLDSLGAVELRNQLQGAVGEGEELPSSLVFEAPTVRALAKYFESTAPVEAPAAGMGGRLASDASETIRVVTAKTLLPGSVTTAREYGRMSSMGIDVAGEVPAARWDAADLDGQAVAAGLDNDIRCL